MTTEAPAKSPIELAREKLAGLQAKQSSLNVEALQAAVTAAMQSGDFAATVKASAEYESGRKEVESLPAAIEAAERNVKALEFDEKAQAIIGEYQEAQDRVRRAITPEMVAKAIEAGVKGVTFDVGFVSHEDGSPPSFTISVKPSNAPASAPRAARAPSTTPNGAASGENRYGPNGMTSRAYVEAYGDQSMQGVKNALETGTGLTHVANAIAKKRGEDVTKATA